MTSLIIVTGVLGLPGGWILPALFALPIPALFVRRLHDTNHSGYWFVGTVAWIPMIGSASQSLFLFLQGYLLGHDQFFRLFSLAVVCIPLLILLVLCGKKGDPHTNRYGPSPLEMNTDGGDDTKEVLPETEKQ